jgi:WxcM-like, C-terminal
MGGGAADRAAYDGGRLGEENCSRSGPLASVRFTRLPGNPEGPRKLTFAHSRGDCPFDIQRAYWLHDLDVGEVRGGHAHKALWQLLVCVSGSVDIRLDDGEASKLYVLDDATRGLILGPGLWRTIRALRPQSTLLVLASAPYSEDDYIRDYSDFLAFRGIRMRAN